MRLAKMTNVIGLIGREPCRVVANLSSPNGVSGGARSIDSRDLHMPANFQIQLPSPLSSTAKIAVRKQ